MEFKRFKRKGLKPITTVLDRLKRIEKIKVFRVERLLKNYNDFDYRTYNGPDLIETHLLKRNSRFFETNETVKYSFFDGELKI